MPENGKVYNFYLLVGGVFCALLAVSVLVSERPLLGVCVCLSVCVASRALLVTMLPAIHAVLLPLALGQTTSNYGTLVLPLHLHPCALCLSFFRVVEKVSLRSFCCAAYA